MPTQEQLQSRPVLRKQADTGSLVGLGVVNDAFSGFEQRGKHMNMQSFRAQVHMASKRMVLTTASTIKAHLAVVSSTRISVAQLFACVHCMVHVCVTTQANLAADTLSHTSEAYVNLQNICFVHGHMCMFVVNPPSPQPVSPNTMQEACGTKYHARSL